jgi:tetratricopeptide (TPR) repeat protein
MIFILSILADYFVCVLFYRKISVDGERSSYNIRDILTIISPVLISFSLYILMNFYLSGNIFPNTFYAKKTFYSPEFMSREYFLKSEVIEFFINGSYKILLPGFMISLIILFSGILKRKRNSNFLYFIFLFMFIFAYWYELPYAGLNDRYLIPLVPFYIIISMSGFYYLLFIFEKYLKHKGIGNLAFYFLFLLIFYYSGIDLKSSLFLFTEKSDYIERTHIRPAKWILNNTDPRDIIATHEIGAIGFYSDRKIIDIAGLVTPELISQLPDKNYMLMMRQYLDKKNVKYFAALNSWCRVVNANPVFSGRSNNQTETFDIYRYTHDELTGIHFPSKEVNRLIVIADYNLRKNLPGKAITYLNQAIGLDSNCSLSFYLKAEASLRTGDKRSYESCLKKAVEIFPEYSHARSELINYYRSENKHSEAEKIISIHNFFLDPKQYF